MSSTDRRQATARGAALLLRLVLPALLAAGGRDFELAFTGEFLQAVLDRALAKAGEASPLQSLKLTVLAGGRVQLTAAASAGELWKRVPGSEAIRSRLAGLGWMPAGDRTVRVSFAGRMASGGLVTYRSLKGDAEIPGCNSLCVRFDLGDVGIEIGGGETSRPDYAAPPELKQAGFDLARGALAELAIGPYLVEQLVAPSTDGGSNTLTLFILADRWPFVPFELTEVTTLTKVLLVRGRQISK